MTDTGRCTSCASLPTDDPPRWVAPGHCGTAHRNARTGRQPLSNVPPRYGSIIESHPEHGACASSFLRSPADPCLQSRQNHRFNLRAFRVALRHGRVRNRRGRLRLLRLQQRRQRERHSPQKKGDHGSTDSHAPARVPTGITNLPSSPRSWTSTGQRKVSSSNSPVRTSSGFPLATTRPADRSTMRSENRLARFK